MALCELEECPEPLLATILDFRAYSRAKQLIKQAKSQSDVPDSPYVDLVFEIESILWRRGKAARQAAEVMDGRES